MFASARGAMRSTAACQQANRSNLAVVAPKPTPIASLQCYHLWSAALLIEARTPAPGACAPARVGSLVFATYSHDKQFQCRGTSPKRTSSRELLEAWTRL